MAQQAPLEPGSVLYDFALTVDLNKVPDKLHCKNCQRFLLNAYKTECCEDSICETCNSSVAGRACPICKHATLITKPSKAGRGTARSYLKTQMANAEASRAIDTNPSLPPESKDLDSAVNGSQANVDAGSKEVEDGGKGDPTPVPQSSEEQAVQSEDVVQSIEEPRELTRRPTLDSASGNEHDDDIEINVGPDYDLSQVPEPSKRSPVDEGDQWFGDQQFYENTRKNSAMPQNQNHPQNLDSSFNPLDVSQMNQLPPEAAGFFDMLQNNNMNPQNMMNNNPFMMQTMMQNLQQNWQMMQNMGMGNMPGMQNMQNMMGMMPNMAMNGQNQNWQSNMMGFMNPNFNSIMNNGASYNQSQQQYQQNFQNGDPRPFNNRNASFDRGRGRKNRGGRGGRAGFYTAFQQSHQDQYGNLNNMPFQNQYNQAAMQQQLPHSKQESNQYDNHDNAPGSYSTNTDKEHDQIADDDEFAPGGQDEVQEALGDSYTKKTSVPPEEPKIEEPLIPDTRTEEYHPEPSTIKVDPLTSVESPKPEPKEEYIPEAYREDLDFASVPPTAPSGPSAKDVPYRARGHSRYPSRGRGSFQGSNGFPPRSPARPIPQQQTHSPPTNQGSGVVGAPTGPRAMREKDAPPPPPPPPPPAAKPTPRPEVDVGFKIRGTANQAKDQRSKEEPVQSATPRSTYDDFDDRDRDLSRRHSKYERKHDEKDEYEADRDRKRRKSRREDDYGHETQDAEYSHSRSNSQDRATSHRSERREREKTREKYSSTSKRKSSSRRYEDEHDDHEGADDYDEHNSRSTRPSKKSSSKYEDREDRERRDRDHERAERDKHRKRSRHDRDREDNYEDEDEEESRRRSRKHKKEHRSREKDDTDMGMRITGRSSASHRTSEAATPPTPQPDKDPHTLEREERNRERMLKEEQRRQAAKGLSGGRTRTFKYEDEIERSLSKPSRRR